LTIIADFSLKTAQATWSLPACAHDGLPIAVAVPVDVKPLHFAQAGATVKAAISQKNTILMRIDLVQKHNRFLEAGFMKSP